MFADKFIQIATYLPSENLYGFGENIHQTIKVWYSPTPLTQLYTFLSIYLFLTLNLYLFSLSRLCKFLYFFLKNIRSLV